MKLFLVLSMMVAVSTTAMAAQVSAKNDKPLCQADAPDYSRVVAYTANSAGNTGKAKSAR